MKWKLIVLSVVAVAMTACSGGDGGSNVSSLRKPDTATDAPATPTPPPAIVTQWATVEVPVEVPVEVTRIVQDVQYIDVTPAPAISGFTDATACNAMTPVPTRALNNADRAAGVVVAGGWPCEGGK